MIGVLLMGSLLLWRIYRLMFRDLRSARGTTMPAPGRLVDGTAIGPEDGRDRWTPIPGVWTALDELQLTRLLVDSAPAEQATANSTDDRDLPVQKKDLP